ncbi:DNA replication complex GINS family protein [Candidatus Bathyarchaeota archaeon]|nr:DNA replication complex GINS family protein [Candidatus Bathyarchaeota archaeon]MBS7627357.1 DNA replication complex GINS family protein [Candidatus Bathyarchaeota archaeon]
MNAGIKHPLRACRLDFENKYISLVASRNLPETKLLGFSVGPYEEGKEYKERFWIAKALVAAGVAKFKADAFMDFSTLAKIHWTEMIQDKSSFSRLPEGFYEKLLLYMADLKAKGEKDPDWAEKYVKSKRYAEDIINYRLKKIVILASYPTVSSNALQALTAEERILYEGLRNLISEWRTYVLGMEALEV